MAPRRGFLATEDSMKRERDRILEELNRYKTENEQAMQLILVTDAVTKAMSAWFIDIERNVATVAAEQRLLAKSNAELLSILTWKRAESTPMGDIFIESVRQIYLGLALQ